MRKVDTLLADYAAFHRTPGNKACHFIGIPLIIFGILTFLRPAPIIDRFTAAEALILIVSLYYFLLDARLASLLLLAIVSIDLIVFRVNLLWPGIAAFVIGWIFQGIGHAVFEKNSPAFFRNLLHLLIGPMFLINEAFHVRDLETRRADFSRH